MRTLVKLGLIAVAMIVLCSPALAQNQPANKATARKCIDSALAKIVEHKPSIQAENAFDQAIKLDRSWKEPIVKFLYQLVYGKPANLGGKTIKPNQVEFGYIHDISPYLVKLKPALLKSEQFCYDYVTKMYGAISIIDVYMDRYPHGKHAPEIWYWSARVTEGQLLGEPGGREQAIKDYREVIKRFPKSPYAKSAAKAIKRLRKLKDD